MVKNLSFLFFVLFVSVLYGQKSITMNRVSSEIKIDGLLDDIWESIPVQTNFEKHLPLDTGKAISQTDVRVAYDDKYFYLFAICTETIEGKYVVQSLKRDFSFPRTDAFVVFIDPYNDGSNGFSFACNPYGAQREGLLQYGGKYGVTTSWDNKWYSETTITDTSWTVEMAIPFNSLRFNETNKHWKINFSRNDQKANETSSWVTVPRNLNVANLAYTGDLIWTENPPVSGKNISLIPYAITGVNDDKPYADIGLDAKVGITSALNLDLTVNPDFSNVEVDRQVTNLDRFEIFYPERRQFFIENSDLFSNLGSSSTRPFFSRRIGVGTDTSGRQVENPILGGVRLSGKLNDNWRVGAMTVQTSNGKDDNLLSENFSVATIQRKLARRSNIGAFVVNKEKMSPQGKYLDGGYNRVAGLEYNLFSKDAVWQGKLYTHLSMDTVSSQGFSQGGELSYNKPSFKIGLHEELVTQDFNAEAGFIRRKDYLYLNPYIEYLFFPKKGKVIFHGPGAVFQQYFTMGFQNIERKGTVYYTAKFNNTSKATVSFINSYVQLRNDFDPSRSGGTKLNAGDGYTWNYGTVDYITDERKDLFFEFTGIAGQYYNGHRYGVDGSLRYRIVPKFVFSMNYSYDNIQLPNPYSSVDWTLLGPEIEILFTTKLFWTTYFQYNQQADNININSRLQWRFKPASDLFVVYTDNYLPENFGNKSRGVVVKFTYWFNI